MIRRLLTLPLLLAAAPAASLELSFPVACTLGSDCWVIHYLDHDPGTGIADSYCGPMTYDGHDGTDIAIRDGAAMRAGVDVVASAAGIVKAVRNSVPDVTVEQGGREAVKGIDCGNGVLIQHEDRWETQYCHMRRDSVVVRPGDKVEIGQKLGLVGLSGMTSFPHLHLAVRKDGAELDPFDGTKVEDACSMEGTSLWRPEVEEALVYQPIAIPVLGFADGPVESDAVWDGTADAARLTTDSPALVVFIGAYTVQKGDRIEIVLTGPDGENVVAHDEVQPRNQARIMRFIGKKRPADGWQAGKWNARATITRDGQSYEAERTVEVGPSAQ